MRVRANDRKIRFFLVLGEHGLSSERQRARLKGSVQVMPALLGSEDALGKPYSTELRKRTYGIRGSEASEDLNSVVFGEQTEIAR